MKIDTIGDYSIELETGPIVNPGYRIYKASWYNRKTHTAHQQPRFKLISTWTTEAEARAEIERLNGNGHIGAVKGV